ncbi:MAG: hypothetical protein COA66_10440 [Arcobacter sp.]|nr:MAG: hypothetical protein COA66_10440 [Arcobacter sp.]
MAKALGDCPYCEGGDISFETKSIQGKRTKLYKCSNNKVFSEDGEMWEQHKNSTCTFRIFGNSLARYGKKFIGPKEVTKLLKGQEVTAHLYSYNKKTEYKKYITINHQYGVSVLWEIDIEDEILNDEDN